MAGRNQNKGAKAVTVSKMEVGDKEATKVVSRDGKYRQFCEGMRDLMQEFPQAKHRIETLMKLNNDIIQEGQAGVTTAEGHAIQVAWSLKEVFP
jgi:hypothetical protein